MIKTVLVIAVLLSASSASQLTSSNYDGLKNFIQGLMDGYYNRTFKLPSLCLNAQEQSKLDSDIIAILGSVTRADFQALSQNFGILVGDLVTLYKKCDLVTLEASLVESFNSIGFLRSMLNFITNLEYIIPDFLATLLDFFRLEAYKSGENIGLILRYVFPPTSQLDRKVKQLLSVPFDPFSFTNGFLIGLEKNPKTHSECFNDLTGGLEGFETIFYDFDKIVEVGGIFYYSKLCKDISTLLKSLESFAKPCDFKSLEKTIRGFLKPGGSSAIITNYVLNMRQINEDWTNIQASLSVDWFAVGKDTGDVLKLITGWGI